MLLRRGRGVDVVVEQFGVRDSGCVAGGLSEEVRGGREEQRGDERDPKVGRKACAGGF